MKRFILPLFSILTLSLTSVNAFAQSNAMEGKVTHSKSSKVAAVIEFPYSVEEVQQAIKNMMAEKGQKPDKSKEFLVFRNATLQSHANELHDLHFKVEKKGRKDKNASLVYLVVGRPSENIALRTESDRHKLEEGKELLNSILPYVEKHHLNVQINTQSTSLDKMKKSLKGLESGQLDNEKKLKQLQDKIAKNKQDQEKLRAEITREEEVLNAMKGRQTN
jgi:hypothetical protein